jgi:hypothetical protein
MLRYRSSNRQGLLIHLDHQRGEGGARGRMTFHESGLLVQKSGLPIDPAKMSSKNRWACTKIPVCVPVLL